MVHMHNLHLTPQVTRWPTYLAIPNMYRTWHREYVGSAIPGDPSAVLQSAPSADRHINFFPNPHLRHGPCPLFIFPPLHVMSFHTLDRRSTPPLLPNNTNSRTFFFFLRDFIYKKTLFEKLQIKN